MKKLLSLLLTGFLLLSLFACNSKKTVTLADVVKAMNVTVEGEVDNQKELSNEEVLQALLKYSEMPKEQIGNGPLAHHSLALSLGMIDKDFQKDDKCSPSLLKKMAAPAKKLYESLHAEKLTPLFLNGMSQPIFPYTRGSLESGYSNDNSNIIRYSVYVETNYDTDGDGKLDLVKAVVQLPKSAAEGNYKAATIFEARPYISGCTPFRDIEKMPGKDKGFDMTKLHATPEKRVQKGESTTMEAAKKAKSNEWYYFSPYEDIYDYENLDWYDYYLIRGFAVVEAAGLGTRASEGFETCGSDVEIDAFKCIIEWLHGDRVAYTDLNSNIAIKADWSNGKIGMIGRSYSGTTQFALASTGVKGLETIVPTAGIASWYEYMNSQGTRIQNFPDDQTSSLALYCAGRYLDPQDWKTIEDNYGAYLHQLQNDTLASGNDYSDVWANRDYTLNPENINCSALIIHGMNDNNVRTKHMEMMYNTFTKAKKPVKLLLHQGAHITPTYNSGKYSMLIGPGQVKFDDLMNTWYSHYLYDVNNGVENIANVIAQSNQDANVWNTYDTYGVAKKLSLKAVSDEKETIITSDYKNAGIDESKVDEALIKQSTIANATFVSEVSEDITLMGSPVVKFKAALNKGSDNDNLTVTAKLIDLSEETFKAYNIADYYVNKDVQVEKGAWQGGGLEDYDIKQFVADDVKYKVIASGWLDLNNPESGFDSASASKKTALKAGEMHEYSLYLQPNVYKVAKGHKLALVLTTYDPNTVSYPEKEYAYTLDNSSLEAIIPAVEKDLSLEAKLLK